MFLLKSLPVCFPTLHLSLCSTSVYSTVIAQYCVVSITAPSHKYSQMPRHTFCLPVQFLPLALTVSSAELLIFTVISLYSLFPNQTWAKQGFSVNIWKLRYTFLDISCPRIDPYDFTDLIASRPATALLRRSPGMKIGNHMEY